MLGAIFGPRALITGAITGLAAHFWTKHREEKKDVQAGQTTDQNATAQDNDNDEGASLFAKAMGLGKEAQEDFAKNWKIIAGAGGAGLGLAGMLNQNPMIQKILIATAIIGVVSALFKDQIMEQFNPSASGEEETPTAEHHREPEIDPNAFTAPQPS